MSQKEKKEPHDLITEEGVKTALKNQCGNDADLLTWKIHDFTQRGDNYASVVSSVLVAYTKNSKRQWTSFIVKISPCGGMMAMNDGIANMFRKESHFYSKIIPALNKELIAAGQPGLKVPKCYHFNLNKDEEIIFLEDLRDEGFKMTDKKKGLDAAHLNLVLQELGRMHAASILLKGTKSREQLLAEYPCLKEEFLNEEQSKTEMMRGFAKGVTEGGSHLIEDIDGYKEVAKIISGFDFWEIILKQMESTPPFEVICHGDCWVNNVLFK